MLLTGNNFLNWNFTLCRLSDLVQNMFTFLCSKDFLRITDGMGKAVRYCGNKTGENLLLAGDKVEITFRSDDSVEQRGYYLVFTLVSQASVSSPLPVANGKWNHKKANLAYQVYQVYLRSTPS